MVFHEDGALHGCIFLTQFWQEGSMRRERALKILLVVVGLLFSAGVYPLMMFVKQEPALAMMLSLYVTLGIFLLLAARNPSANRSLIAFTAWSSFAHAAVMGMQAFRHLIPRGELVGVAVLVIIGVALMVLAPAKQSVERIAAVVV
jgi:drug/metabolite transporter superfamily protein YnfA